MDHHTLAGISIAGSCLDVLGSLYLAYDLLGGQHGPLRVLTRAVTYSVVFGIGYGYGLGLFFGIASGAATGFTLAVELNRAARNAPHLSLPWEGLFSAIRGVAFAAGLYRMVGFRFAAAFGVLIIAGQIFAYSQGVRPSIDYEATRRLRLRRKHLLAAVARTIGYIVSALVCSALVQHVEHPWAIALRIGLVTGIVTTVGLLVSPFVEFFSDRLPERRMGAFGIGLIFIGFTLQSVQYWLAMFDVPIR